MRGVIIGVFLFGAVLVGWIALNRRRSAGAMAYAARSIGSLAGCLGSLGADAAPHLEVLRSAVFDSATGAKKAMPTGALEEVTPTIDLIAAAVLQRERAKGHLANVQLMLDWHQLVVDAHMVKVRQTARKAARRLPKNVHYILASSPEYDLQSFPALQLAIAVVREYDGDNVAGDAHDKFHKFVITPDEMQKKGWRTAWKGKVQGVVQNTGQRNHGKTIVLLTIDGGYECQLELQTLEQDIIPQFGGSPDIKLKRCADVWQVIDYFGKEGGALP